MIPEPCQLEHLVLFVCFDALCPSLNSYGHVGTVSSPSHTFFLGKLDIYKRLTSTFCTYFPLLLTKTLLDSAEGGEII